MVTPTFPLKQFGNAPFHLYGDSHIPIEAMSVDMIVFILHFLYVW